MAYECTTEEEESLVNIGSTFVAQAQAAELMKPTQRAFDDPAGLAQTAAVGSAFTSQSVSNSQRRQPTVMSGTAVGPISLHDRWTLTRAAELSTQRRNGAHQSTQRLAVVHLGAGQFNTQRNALGIGEKMMLTAFFAAIRRVATRLEPPKTARTLLESTTARDQSIRSAACNRHSSSRWSFFHTPAFCQSRNRRQQVMPLPQPSSLGRSSQPIPVLSTKRIPLSAARSGIRFRPGYFCRRALHGSSGSITSHNESSISGFAMPSLLQS